ncbi:MAG: LytTR family transcriptional regulator [Lactobacillaceae bacterium]|jgi:DNA-binding LytR/AlgR family response regulator|nr:LytTR family transcriptional regulator [Lactobacillaceae bacterium]
MKIIFYNFVKKSKSIVFKDFDISGFDQVIIANTPEDLFEMFELFSDFSRVLFMDNFNEYRQYESQFKKYSKTITLLSDNVSLPTVFLNKQIQLKNFFLIEPSLNHKKNKYVEINTKTRSYQIDEKKLVFIETLTGTHKVRIHLVDKDFDINGSINRIEDDNFEMLARIHNSYLVNEKFISKVEGDLIFLKNNLVLPLSRNNKHKLLDFLLTGEHKSVSLVSKRRE